MKVVFEKINIAHQALNSFGAVGTSLKMSTLAPLLRSIQGFIDDAKFALKDLKPGTTEHTSAYYKIQATAVEYTKPDGVMVKIKDLPDQLPLDIVQITTLQDLGMMEV
jgi:hypothetical protein